MASTLVMKGLTRPRAVAMPWGPSPSRARLSTRGGQFCTEERPVFLFSTESNLPSSSVGTRQSSKGSPPGGSDSSVITAVRPPVSLAAKIASALASGDRVEDMEAARRGDAVPSVVVRMGELGVVVRAGEGRGLAVRAAGPSMSSRVSP